MIWASGYNGNGRLGVGDAAQRNSHVSIARVGNYVKVASVGTGLRGVICLDTSGVAYGWGNLSNGFLNDGTISANTLTPMAMSNPPSKFVDIQGTSNQSAYPGNDPYAAIYLSNQNVGISYFDSSSVVDGTYVTSYVDTQALADLISKNYNDTYLDTSSEISKVYAYYQDQNGRQVRRLIFNSPEFSCQAKWNLGATDGTWQKTLMTAVDSNGAMRDIPGADLGVSENVTHQSGKMNLNAKPVYNF
jgi:hypothetical protein